MKLYQELLNEVLAARHRLYASDPELREAMAEAVEVALIELLQKLAASENQKLSAQRQAMTVAQ